jgi:hypothetical protein
MREILMKHALTPALSHPMGEGEAILAFGIVHKR